MSRAGFEKASQIHREMKAASAAFSLKEVEIDTWGSELVARGRLKEAIEVFKLNVDLYPASFAVYRSLGVAYMNDGNKELAVQNLAKAVELNPEDPWNRSLLNKLREQK